MTRQGFSRSAYLCSAASAVMAAASPAVVLAQDEAATGAEADKSENVIVVTANRRSQDVTGIPFNISVVGGEQLAASGIATVEDLSQQVPNLVVASRGTQNLGAQRQVMRGLSASPSDRQGQTLEQNSVSTYLDNAPYANFFPIRDVARVEVLRGPQGTLYGAGSLGGAIRLIAREPELGRFSGSVGASLGVVKSSDDFDYSAEAVLNIPLGETLAARFSVAHDRNAGYIDAIGLFVTENGDPLGKPVLANPADPVGSSAQRENRKDVNRDEATFVRGALKWEPTDKFSATLAYNRVESEGFAPNVDNPNFNGGPDPFDPSVTYPDTGEFEVVRRLREPFDRTSQMWTADLSYDAGFATLSTTTSFFETDGQTSVETSLGTASLPPIFVPYYTGTPANPRFNSISVFTDRTRSFTQEIRLVSAPGETFDYVVGAFYQREKRTDLWSSFGRGQFDYNNLPGVINFSGIGADDRFFTVGGTQTFTDKSVFGELTWHVTDRLDVTGGVRLFKQSLSRDVESNIPNFFLFEQASNETDVSDQIFKANLSYALTDNHRFYAIFSQGFRRGGANAFALSGFAQEPAEILNYRPDKVDNYEIGFKGRFDSGWVYAIDAFYDVWFDPQIGTFTPYNVWPVTVNGERARTQGIEFELRGPISEAFDVSLGYAYTEANLTRDFCIPAGVGDGVNFDPCAIPGVAGTPLPSAPKHSGSAILNYQTSIGSDMVLRASTSANYKSSMTQALPSITLRNPVLPAYWLFDVNASLEIGKWTLGGYVRNLFNERAVYNRYARITPFTPLDLEETVGRPREAGVTLRLAW